MTHFSSVFHLKSKGILWLLCSALCSVIAWAQDGNAYTIKQVPNVQLQDKTQFVSDPQHIVEFHYQDSINWQIAQMRQSSQIEVAVVVLPNFDQTEYASARDFAFELFNLWRIGDKETDKGLLILLFTAPDAREVVFEVGYGLEGDLPDGLCKLIQTRKMLPFLKEQRYSEALWTGVKEVAEVLGGTSELAEEHAASQSEEDMPSAFWVIIILLIWIVVALLNPRSGGGSSWHSSSWGGGSGFSGGSWGGGSSGGGGASTRF